MKLENDELIEKEAWQSCLKFLNGKEHNGEWYIASSYANLPEVKEIRDATKEEIEDWLKEE